MMLSCKVSLAMHNAFFLPYLSSSFLFLKMVENLCEDVTYTRRKKKEMWIANNWYFSFIAVPFSCKINVIHVFFQLSLVRTNELVLIWYGDYFRVCTKLLRGSRKYQKNAGTSLLHRKLLSTETKRVKKCFVSSTFVTAREGDAYSFQKTMVFRVAPSPVWSTILTTAESLLKDYLLSHLSDVILQL